jgi:hypothetical protein
VRVGDMWYPTNTLVLCATSSRNALVLPARHMVRFLLV